MRHGTANGYQHHKCRCPECKVAYLQRSREQRSDRYRRTKENGGVAPTQRHNASTAANWGCRCEICSHAMAARNARNAGKWPETRKRVQARVVRRHQQESLATAQRSNYVWSGPELELADRKDLTSRQVAEMTGRTLFAVRRMRRRIATGDPRLDGAIGNVEKRKADR